MIAIFTNDKCYGVTLTVEGVSKETIADKLTLIGAQPNDWSFKSIYESTPNNKPSQSEPSAQDAHGKQGAV